MINRYRNNTSIESGFVMGLAPLISSQRVMAISLKKAGWENL